MPTVIVLGNIKLTIYADDHNPPHFHVITPDTEAMVAIADLSLIAGTMDRKTARAVLAWAEANRDTLNAAWDKLNG